MSYVDGFIIPVPTENREEYRDHAARAGSIFKDYGAIRIVECWGDNVPEGKVTDFHRAVKAEPAETVVFGWVEWPSKEVRDVAWEKMMSDDRMSAMNMPFDGKRMIYGGFATILDDGPHARN